MASVWPGPPVRSPWRVLLMLIGGTAVLIALLLYWFAPAKIANGSITSPPAFAQGHPPWIYGHSDARFTIIEYADFECPYCREYFPILKRWVTQHPEANWQWHHLPLAIHEPAATRAARIAECAGEVGGNRAFWNAVAWLYQHTQGNGAGLPAGAQLPEAPKAIQSCLRSSRPDRAIQAQADAAARDHVTATPTLRLVDRKTGKTLTLQGIVEDDTLLSAIDLLVAPTSDMGQAPE